MNTTMHAHWISLLHEHYALLAHSSVQNTTHGLKYPLTTEYGPISTLLNPHLDMSIAFVCLYDPRFARRNCSWYSNSRLISPEQKPPKSRSFKSELSDIYKRHFCRGGQPTQSSHLMDQPCAKRWDLSNSDTKGTENIHL